MRKQSDLEGMKFVAKSLCRAVPIENIEGLPLCNHPFTDSTISYIRQNIVDLSKKEELKLWQEHIDKCIDNIKKIEDFYLIIRKPWLLTFLKFSKNYFSKEDFSKFLADSWVFSECPNDDKNVSISELIKWYKQADKKSLMEPEDYAYWEALPNKVTVYRGVCLGHNPKGLSWTDNKEKAEWFRDRWKDVDKNNTRVLLKATIDKKHCLAYFNTRNEMEIIVDSLAIRNEIECKPC